MRPALVAISKIVPANIATKGLSITAKNSIGIFAAIPATGSRAQVVPILVVS